MKQIFRTFAIAFMLSVAAAPSFSQTGKTPTYPPIDSDALEQFGGPEGVRLWVESLFHFIMLDNRINKVFREFGNIERQMYLNTQLLQLVLGGNDQEYQGASMAAAHADLGITVTQFNAVVEAAYNACDRTNLTYEACNLMIAGLAPYKHAIVTR